MQVRKFNYEILKMTKIVIFPRKKLLNLFARAWELCPCFPEPHFSEVKDRRVQTPSTVGQFILRKQIY